MKELHFDVTVDGQPTTLTIRLDPVLAPAPPPIAAPPLPPTTYVIPSGALPVSSSLTLAAALQSTPASDFVLADGVYDATAAYLVNSNGHRLYAAHLGKAVLKCGMTLGGNYGAPGGKLQGLLFDVSDRTKTLDGHIVNNWGPMGDRCAVLDTEFRGNKLLTSGLRATRPEGLVVQRIVARDFTDYGVFLHQYSDVASVITQALLEDIDVRGVSRAVPRSANGTAEAGIWIGARATARRMFVRDCAWMGIWTGGKIADATLEHFDVDGTPVGVYPEHDTLRVIFQNFRIGPAVVRGFNCEWRDIFPAGAAVDCLIQDGYIASSLSGVQMNPGTTRTGVQRIRFVGQSKAAIVDTEGIGNWYKDNDYSGILPGAVPVTADLVP